ncbi:MAG: HNH endonuclease [Polyangiaceae bacterium]|nr:HNH endonuclease [Polyangiaceae bacterium]
MPVSLDRRVRERAGHRCEYCAITQTGQEATFHIDHVQPRAHGGATSYANLALACVSCSLRKGARTSASDPNTGESVAIYSPRRDEWRTHFRVTDTCLILGLTPTGRATVEALQMNRLLAVAIRREERIRGRYA